MLTSIVLTLKVLAGILILFVTFLGWGRLVSKFLSRVFKSLYFSKTTWMFFWLGFVFVLFLLQIIHLFIPISIVVSIVFLAVGLLSFLIFTIFERSYLKLKQVISSSWILMFFFVFLVIILSNLLFSKNLGYDFGLYYRQAISWEQSYAIIPGLANIENRLGFNNITFLISACIDNLKFIPQNFRLLTGLLYFFLLGHSMLSLKRFFVLKRKSLYNIYWGFSSLFILFVIFYNQSLYFINNSPDSFVIVLELVIAGELIKIIETKSTKNTFTTLIPLIFVLFCIKLSTAIFSLFAFLIVLSMLIKYNRRNHITKDALAYLLLTSLLILIWVLRSIILTGYPLFPSTILGGYLDWSVPAEQAKDTMSWILSWAREPNVAPSSVLENWYWLKKWIISNLSNWFVLVSVFMGIIFTISNFIKTKFNRSILVLMILPISSLAYWFFSAPDTRFAMALFWIFFIYSVLFSYQIWSSRDEVLIGGFLISIVMFLSSLLGTTWIDPRSYTTNLVYPSVEVYTVKNIGEFEIYKSKTGDQCWNSHFICITSNDPKFKIYTTNSGRIAKIVSE